MKDDRVSITSEFEIDPAQRGPCLELLREARLIYLRNGAHSWHLYEELSRPNHFQLEVVAPSWDDYVKIRERMTKDEKEVLDKFHSLTGGPECAERVRAGLTRYGNSQEEAGSRRWAPEKFGLERMPLRVECRAD